MISNLTVGEKLGKSDHIIVKFEIKANFLQKMKSFRKPNSRKDNFKMLRNEVRKIGKSPAVDVEFKWSSLKGKYMAIRNNCIYQKKIYINSNEPGQPK